MEQAGRERCIDFYKAEKLKNRHSAIGRLTILMPLISVILSAVLTSRFFTIDSYNWWYMMLFPGLVSLICGLRGQRDKKMGNRSILTLPEDPKHVWDGKVLYVIREPLWLLIVIFAASVVIAAILQREHANVFCSVSVPGKPGGGDGSYCW